MRKSTHVVLGDALQLDREGRAEVAAELLASLDGPEDADAEAAWDAEIARRVAALESGDVTLSSWPDVRKRVEESLRRR